MRSLFLFWFAVMLSAAIPAAAEDEATFATGDRIDLEVAGFPDLSGSFSVRRGNILKLPNGVQIELGGWSQEVLEERLGAKLQERLGTVARVNVRSVTWRPIYVHGDVMTPSAIPYVVDLTAMKAVVLAGGFRTGGSDISATIANLNARRDEGKAAVSLEVLLAREARLMAELEDASEVKFPDGPAWSQADSQAGRVAAAEEAIFASRRARRTALADSLRTRAKSQESQVSSLKSNQDLLEEALRLTEEELEAATALADQGLQTRSRLNDAKRERLGLLAELSGNAARLAEAETKLEENRQLIVDNEFKHVQETNAELAETRRLIGTALEDLTASQAIIETTARTGVRIHSIGRPHEGVHFVLTRDKDDREVGPHTPLLPGDLLRIEQPVHGGQGFQLEGNLR